MSAILSATNVSFSYGARPVLRNISLSLSAGEVVALLGPNGSGKTTLIRALLGHLKPAGAIEWNGQPIRSWTRQQLARKVAYLPQTPTFQIGQTVSDVLRLGRAPYWKAFGIESQYDTDVVQRVAQTLELTDLLDRPIDLLSGGQRQRVFIGRCVVQEPLAMLLDEPNTFLDLKHQIELGKLLRKLATEQQMAVLMASHDINLAASLSQKLLLLSEGELIASGSAQDVLQPDMLSKVYGVQMQRTVVNDSRTLVYPESV